MQKFFVCGLFFLIVLQTKGQELFVFSEPASNMPAKSMSAKLTVEYMGPQEWHDRSMQRYMPEVMLGLNKNWMFHVGATFADMHTPNFRWESVFLYGKYRFLSKDDVHKHFRMAAFVQGSYSRSPYHNDEVSIKGDKSGVKFGIIATQLINKFAVSSTVSHTQVLDESRNNDVMYIPSRIYQSFDYSLSAGYLLLPREYTDYKQLNVNLYTELLGQQTLDRKTYYIDLAPSVQFILNSNSKLNLGYRFQLSGDQERMALSSWLISFERTFLNALSRK